MKCFGLVDVPRVFFSATHETRFRTGLGPFLADLDPRIGDHVAIMWIDDTLDVAGLVIGKSFGGVAWLPAKKNLGGTIVCWKEAGSTKTGKLSDARVRALLPAKAKRIGGLDIDGPQILASFDLVPVDEGFTWARVPIVAGDYDVWFAKPTKTPLGTLAFITLTPKVATPAKAPKPAKTTKPAKAAKTTKPAKTAKPTRG